MQRSRIFSVSSSTFNGSDLTFVYRASCKKSIFSVRTFQLVLASSRTRINSYVRIVGDLAFTFKSGFAYFPVLFMATPISLMEVNICFCSSCELITDGVFLACVCLDEGCPLDKAELVLCPSSFSSNTYELCIKVGSSSLPKLAVW
jgi:hypothetical protein